MKFSKPFTIILKGETRPTCFKKGDECPKHVEKQAKEASALETSKTTQ